MSCRNDAARLWVQAVELRRLEPAPIGYMWQLADREVEAKRRFSFRWAAEQVRRRDYTAHDGTRFKFSNDLVPALARMYLIERPEARKYVILKRSRFDGMGGEA